MRMYVFFLNIFDVVVDVWSASLVVVTLMNLCILNGVND